MRALYSPALKGRRALLVALRTLSYVASACLAFAAVLVSLMASRRPELGLGRGLTPLAIFTGLGVLTSAWFGRLHRALACFGWRPAGEGAALPQSGRHAVLAAEEAFDQGRFERVPALLERVAEADRGADLWLFLGRALALSGADGAEAALERGGERRKNLALLRPRRVFGVESSRPAPIPARLARLPGMACLALLQVVLAVGAWRALEAKMGVLRPTAVFDETAFLSETDGPITFYYHDADFLGFAEPLAQDALAADLAFLDLAPGAFGPGSVRIYLCDSEAEYRRRAPYQPAWEAACADPPRATVYIHRFTQKDGGRLTFEVVLAHELGHLCYYRLAGPSPDDWLNEGLADYLGFKFGLERERVPRQAWLQDHFFAGLRAQALPFDRFFRTDPRDLPNAEVGTFYRQGFSVVYFLVEDYGREPFLAFLKARGREKDMDRALALAYPTIPDVAALAAVWGLFYPVPDVSGGRPGA